MACVEAMAAPAAVIATGTSRKFMGWIKAPANQALRVKRVVLTFTGNSSSAVPGLIELKRLSSDGTGGTSATPSRKNLGSETIQTTAKFNESGTPFTVDPGESGNVDIKHTHPQGQYGWTPVSFDEVQVPGGGRLGVFVTFAVDVNCMIAFHWEE